MSRFDGLLRGAGRILQGFAGGDGTIDPAQPARPSGGALGAVANWLTGLGSRNDPSSAYSFRRPRELDDLELLALGIDPIGARVLRLAATDAVCEGWDCEAGPRWEEEAEAVEDASAARGDAQALVEACARADQWGRSALVLGYDDPICDWVKPPPRGARLRWTRVYDRRQFRVERWRSAESDGFGRPHTLHVWDFWSPELEGDRERDGGLMAALMHEGPRIHHSRFCDFAGPGGRSVFLGLAQSIAQFLSAARGVEGGLQSVGTAVHSIAGLRGMIESDPAGTFRYVAELERIRRFVGALVLDKERESYAQLGGGSSLTGASDLFYAVCGVLSANVGCPQTKLFGFSPGGLGSNGEGEQRDWEKRVRWTFRSRILPAAVRLHDADWARECGEPPPWDLVPRGLSVPSDSEAATIVKTLSEAAQIQLEAGTVTVREARASLNGGPGRLPASRIRADGPAPEVEDSIAPDDATLGPDGAPPAPEDPKLTWRTLRQIADLLGCEPHVVRALAAAGVVRARTRTGRGGAHQYALEQVRDALRARERGGPAPPPTAPPILAPPADPGAAQTPPAR